MVARRRNNQVTLGQHLTTFLLLAGLVRGSGLGIGLPLSQAPAAEPPPVASPSVGPNSPDQPGPFLQFATAQLGRLVDPMHPNPPVVNNVVPSTSAHVL